MITPAEITNVLAHMGLPSKSPGLGWRGSAATSPSSPSSPAAPSAPPSSRPVTSSSIPPIFTYPPSGTQLITYSVSPHWKPNIVGPKPIEKRCTSIPTDFAAMK